MITQILNFTSKKRLLQVYLKEYHRYETVSVNTHLHDTRTCDEHIEILKERFIDEPDDLILVVVKYNSPKVAPMFFQDKKAWKIWRDNNKNVWGFKILNPKMFKDDYRTEDKESNK